MMKVVVRLASCILLAGCGIGPVFAVRANGPAVGWEAIGGPPNGGLLGGQSFSLVEHAPVGYVSAYAGPTFERVNVAEAQPQRIRGVLGSLGYAFDETGGGVFAGVTPMVLWYFSDPVNDHAFMLDINLGLRWVAHRAELFLSAHVRFTPQLSST